ncbi:Endoplasmic reticulum-based factor for assembly of V-ATPase [Geosmithia morbida]|uniref:Endoplasmic reticulum-based factor for assembly of V-ATPase n=1 Tax=Geosmithia morbida TaxID=1094350 RepID=A0A9P5D4L6_9HYPO|nr:Endoplasmic reticulum-based factor for assembly of V-ATPase [Geosmithia morbida]KAF4126197.1 Endoplasmic reticulum-based factor for assembly of V-ATPase [Geosmithia morbida]
MVLLTMTASMVESLGHIAPGPELCSDEASPSLDQPAVGKPIAHSQIINLWKQLKTCADAPSISLEKLLVGAVVYIPPPPPKPEPTPQFKALMARLRREEEDRVYQRMLNPHSDHHNTTNGYAQAGPAQRAFAAVNQPHTAADTGDNDATYNDVHRQLLLLINFLVSIIGVAATLWIAARWWSVPARLFLTMGGSLVVAVAEVAVYSIYVWRLEDSKHKEEEVKETKEVAETWTVEPRAQEHNEPVSVDAKNTDGMRKRVTTVKEED